MITIIRVLGDSDHLREHGIPVVQHLPGVGQNLQDHLELYVVQKCKKPVTLLGDQKGLRMIRVGVQWFLNQTGTLNLQSLGLTRLMAFSNIYLIIYTSKDLRPQVT